MQDDRARQGDDRPVPPRAVRQRRWSPVLAAALAAFLPALLPAAASEARTKLPVVTALRPPSVHARTREWVTLQGEHFEDLPGRACLVGGELVGGISVRYFGPRAVQCRMPMLAVDTQNVSVTFSNDGTHFAGANPVLEVRVQPVMLVLEPPATYVATTTSVTVRGRHFIPGVECLFDEWFRVQPMELEAERIVCEMPGALGRAASRRVSVRLVEISDPIRPMRPSSRHEDRFYVELRPRPVFHTVFPSNGTVAGGTYIVLRGTHLNFDEVVACLFDGSDEPSPAEATAGEIRCLTVGPRDGLPIVANITIRYFNETPFLFEPTGLEFRFFETVMPYSVDEVAGTEQGVPCCCQGNATFLPKTRCGPSPSMLVTPLLTFNASANVSGCDAALTVSLSPPPPPDDEEDGVALGRSMGASLEDESGLELLLVRPESGPLAGGTEVTITIGGHGAPPRRRCECRFGAVRVMAACITQLRVVRCTTPAALLPGEVGLRVSLDGLGWSATNLSFVYYGAPAFVSVEPPLGNMLGVNNVTIRGEHFPTTATNAMCRWQGTYIGHLTVHSPSAMSCPVPSRSLFQPFLEPYQPVPMGLEVSFSSDPPMWFQVDRDLNFTHHQVPSRQEQMLDIFPRVGLASLGGHNVTIGCSGLPYPTPRPHLAGCVFGRHLLTPAWVLDNSTLTCIVPLLASVAPMQEAPYQARVDLTFDGGQTVTRMHSVYAYLKDFEFDSMIPSYGLFNDNTTVAFTGDYFARMPDMKCRFGDIVVDAVLTSSRLMYCVAPPQPAPGPYEVAYSVDGLAFKVTEFEWLAVERPVMTHLHPERGLRFGGTTVSVYHDGRLEYNDTLRCAFGYVMVATLNIPAENRIECSAPPCMLALYEDGIVPDGIDCYGVVDVRMTYTGLENFFGNLTYEYVQTPRVELIDPFAASGWNRPLVVTLVGEHFQDPMFCRWENMSSELASNVTNTSMVCTAPVLPEERRPGPWAPHVESLLGHVEVSPNDQDWTRFKFAFLWYKEPNVSSIVPESTLEGLAPEGDFVVYGQDFRFIRADMVECAWHYDSGEPAEQVAATLLGPNALKCKPTVPAMMLNRTSDEEEWEIRAGSWVTSESVDEWVNTTNDSANSTNESVNATNESANGTNESANRTDEWVNITDDWTNSTDKWANSTDWINNTDGWANSTDNWTNNTNESINGSNESGNASIEEQVPLPRVSLEVAMTYLVNSLWSVSVLSEERMRLVDRPDGSQPAVSPMECPLTGGCPMVLRGRSFWPKDQPGVKLFVLVGDALLETAQGPERDLALFRLPPLPHMVGAPALAAIQLTRNLQDRTAVGINMTYQPISTGDFYRPELHHGRVQRCEPGHSCKGAGANQSLWEVTGEVPMPCAPGAWQGDQGAVGCRICPEGVACPMPGLSMPQISDVGYVTWGGDGFDANQPLCPAGIICLRPLFGKSRVENTTVRRLARRHDGLLGIFPDPEEQLKEEVTGLVEEDTLEPQSDPRRLRLAPAIPSSVRVLPCPAGYYCPPGSIAQETVSIAADGSLTVGIEILSAQPCVNQGIVCSEGTYYALSTDIVPAPGEYISDDLTMVLPCPSGYACPGGAGNGEPQPCPPGQYQVTAGSPVCATCTAGTVCPGFGAVYPELCPAGRVCAHPGRVLPSYLCPAGSFCPPGVFTLNTQLDMPGVPKICPSGTYCLQGTATAVVNSTGTGTAKACVEGTFCGPNTTTPGGTDNCPPGWYCRPGVAIPEPSPPGHYVNGSGAVYPSKCPPGAYAPRWLMTQCLPCPPGTECPLDGTVFPTNCSAGTYREATPDGVDFTNNVMCIPCPQGTWNEDGSLTSVQACKSCAERYVCPLEGTTKFATIDNQCGPNPGPDEICYPQNSMALDCPQGYGCGIATTAFTQYDNYCEPGFWCKVRTRPSEVRNLLCPAGYYCKRNTGESGGSGRLAFECPIDHYCPEGTAALDGRLEGRLVTLLYNVQADYRYVTQIEPDRRAMCRRCPEDSLPESFNFTLCTPCGVEITEQTIQEQTGNFSASLRRLGARDSGSFGVELLAGLPRSSVTIIPFEGDASAVSTEELVDVDEWLKGSTFKRQLRNWEKLDLAGPWSLGGELEEVSKTDSSIDEDEEVFAGSGGRRLAESDWFICAPDITVDPPTPYREGMPCFAARRAWQGDLQCPVGTSSTIGAREPDDCKQIGNVIVQQNIYKCYPAEPVDRWCFHRRRAERIPSFTVADCTPEMVLCNITEPLEEFRQDTQWKKTYYWGDPIANSIYNRNVSFFGFDPTEDFQIDAQRPFHKIHMEPMDIAILYFDFSKMNPGTRLNTVDRNEGHIDIHIHSDLLLNTPRETLGHTLPPFFQRHWNARAHYPFEMKILALEALDFSVQLDLRHGGHVEFIETLHESLDIRRFSPYRTEWGTRKFFAAVLSREALLDGNYELPYNMPPGLASHPGEEGLVIDASNLSGRLNQPQNVAIDGDRGLLKQQSTGQAFWTSADVETVVFPWVPFFSSCETFDSHIILWDLFEQPDGTRDGCEKYDKSEVQVVPQLGINFEDLTIAFQPTADNCNFVVKCDYEESMAESDNSYIIWREIPEASWTLFYLTRDPIEATDFVDGNSEDIYADEVGGDNLIKVEFVADSKTGRIPRRIHFEINYFQQTTEKKAIVNAGMGLEMWDDNEDDTTYYLMISFQALEWEDLMNAFELHIFVYALLYCVIGLGAVGLTMICWFGIRLTINKSHTNPFHFKEQYEFMLWWPMQGVIIASIPIVVLCAVIKISFLPIADLTQNIPCTYSGWSIGNLDATEQERCRNGRTGTCFMIGGTLMLWSGSRLLVPQLREEEEQFLLQQTTPMLNKEGIPLPADKRKLIRQVPIRWKRCHLLLVSLLLVLPLMILWEFTYSDFFGLNAVHFIVGFSVAMNSIDHTLSRAMREELLMVPLTGAANVVLYIGTLGADDFTDFCEGFFIELVIAVLERLVLGSIINQVSYTIHVSHRWLRTRAWFWGGWIRLGSMLGFAPGQMLMPAQVDEDEERHKQLYYLGFHNADDDFEIEGTPMEEAMDEIIGCGITSMSTIQAPVLIAVIMVFAKETAIPVNYGIKESDFVNYLLFGLVIAPFQVLMDILMNHAVEMKENLKIYDYMQYSKLRWKNRLWRWLYDDPQMDKSVAEPLQSVNHLAFSPQFYFVETYYSWGMLMLLLAITVLLRWEMNMFDDPALWFFILQQLICNRLLDKIIRVMISQILWKPKDNAVRRAFSRSVEHSLQRKEFLEDQERFRKWFLAKYTGWMVGHMHEVFTPRARKAYQAKLSELYQAALALQPSHAYKVPGPALPEGLVGDRDSSKDTDSWDSKSEDGEDKSAEKPPPLPSIAPPPEESPMAALPSPAQLPVLELPSTGGPLAALPPPPQLPLPALPPPASPAAPTELALALPEPEVDMPPIAGFGQFTGLVGKAWLLTARRHVRMAQLAELWRKEWPPLEACQLCGRQEEDPLVEIRLKVVLQCDMHELVAGFEQHHHVPEMPFEEQQWRAWLVREDTWATLCQECHHRQKLQRNAAAAAAAPRPKVAALGDGPRGDTPRSSESSGSDSSARARRDGRPAWGQVEVDIASREMICFWAKVARRRCRQRREQPPATLALGDLAEAGVSLQHWHHVPPSPISGARSEPGEAVPDTP